MKPNRWSIMLTAALALAISSIGTLGTQRADASPSDTPAGTYGKIQLAAGVATKVPSKALSWRTGIAVVNLDSARIWCGWDANVTTATGFPVEPNGGSRAWAIGWSGVTQELWCISAAGQTSPNDTRYQEVR